MRLILPGNQTTLADLLTQSGRELGRPDPHPTSGYGFCGHPLECVMRGCVLLSILTACSLGQTAEEGPDVTVNGDSLVVVNGEVYGSDVAATPEDGAVDSPGTQERVVRIDDATTSVHVLGSIPVFVTLGPEPGAMVSCDRNRMSGIIVDNKPDHLLVMGDVGSSGEGCSVTVTVSSLDDVRSMGSAEVVLSELSGDLSISLLGSGDIIANGVAPRLTLDSLGSGSIKADGLVGTDATVTLTGSGDVFFNASATANLTLMGSGDIHLTGAARPHPGDLQAPMGGWYCRRHVHPGSA